jgi:hypothetical protein
MSLSTQQKPLKDVVSKALLTPTFDKIYNLWQGYVQENNTSAVRIHGGFVRDLVKAKDGGTAYVSDIDFLFDTEEDRTKFFQYLKDNGVKEYKWRKSHNTIKTGYLNVVKYNDDIDGILAENSKNMDFTVNNLQMYWNGEEFTLATEFAVSSKYNLNSCKLPLPSGRGFLPNIYLLTTVLLLLVFDT